eukprot:scaffold338_cov116-Cylindrotheca_fusiformis.AAC.7
MATIFTISLFLFGGCHAFSPPFRGKSRMFLDTADTMEWDDLLPTGIFHGVTTNPTLLERAGEECTIENLHRLAAIALDMTDEFMCQAWGRTAEEMYDRGKALSRPARDRIVIKVPVTQTGTEAASMLIEAGCRVCLTACYNHQQALIASSVGAEYLAPYLGRLSDGGLDGPGECLKMQQITKGLKSETRILVASIRNSQTIADLAAQGMETFTFAPPVARELFNNYMTTEAAAVFEEAAANNKE